jgi:hypothetical protein
MEDKMPAKKTNTRPTRDIMEHAHAMAKRETPTKARDWLRENSYSLTREQESELYLRANGNSDNRTTRKGWRVLAKNDPELATLSGRGLSMSAALTDLRAKGISVPRCLESEVDAARASDSKQPALRLVDAPKPQTQEPALVSADTILAAVRLATGKASKEDIAAVAKAIGADAAIKLLLT